MQQQEAAARCALAKNAKQESGDNRTAFAANHLLIEPDTCELQASSAVDKNTGRKEEQQEGKRRDEMKQGSKNACLKVGCEGSACTACINCNKFCGVV